jgi:starvation-inducible outer membrane lipoprotein
MRTQRRTVTLALVIAALFVAACASIPPDRQVLNTITIIRESAVSTMTVIGQMYQMGQVNEAQKLQAQTIYTRLEIGCKAVAASASTVTTVQQGTDLTVPLQQLADQLKALLLTFQKGGAT